MIGTIVATVVASMLTYGATQGIEMYGNKISKKLQTQAKQIYTQIAKNSNLADKITEAYNRKDNELVTELVNGAGFGSRAAALQEARAQNLKEYQTNKQSITGQNAKLQNAYNQATQASYNTGDIAGISQGKDVLTSNDSVSQLVEGGLTK